MTYSLEFDARALKEWKSDTVRQQLKKKLAEVLLNPTVNFESRHGCQAGEVQVTVSGACRCVSRALGKQGHGLSIC